jgi:hypothetical protein
MGDHQNHDLTWMIWGVPHDFGNFMYITVYRFDIPYMSHDHFIRPTLELYQGLPSWKFIEGDFLLGISEDSKSSNFPANPHQQWSSMNILSYQPKKHVFNHLQPFNPVHHSKQHINAWRSWPSPAASQGLAAACAASSALPVHWEDVVERMFVLEQPPVTIGFKPNCSNDWMIWVYPHFGKAPCEERGRVF